MATDFISSSVRLQTTNPSSVKYTGVADNITSRAVLDYGQIEVNRNNLFCFWGHNRDLSVDRGCYCQVVTLVFTTVYFTRKGGVGQSID